MVSLKCGSCGADIGEASHEDNYKEKFYHTGKDGQWICKNCGEGTFGFLRRNLFIFGIIVAVGIIMLAYFTS